MSWTVEFNGKSGIIEIVYVGHSTGADLRESTTKGIALTNELGVLDVLVDSTELEAPPLTDIYDLPAKQYDAEGLSRRIRIALIQPKLPSALKATEFYRLGADPPGGGLDRACGARGCCAPRCAVPTDLAR